MTTGVLLVNLGTPDAPRPREVRRYLAELNRRETQGRLQRWEVIRARQAAFIARQKALVTGNLEEFLRMQVMLREFMERREQERIERLEEFLLQANEFNPSPTPN